VREFVLKATDFAHEINEMKHAPPGFLRAGVDPDVVMMICTAGHVDHGKTSLVKLLTGCNTDRLKIEQERGMTIELGFAPCVLAGRLCVGIVDVPGHEKFIRNMVAGVSGIGMTVLVIAADDGIMPQTIEHFHIMDLLGVSHGMIALTKTDLVSPDRVAELQDEIARFFRGTFLEGAPICPVSSETFEGYSEFYETLCAEIDRLVARRASGTFRMPIERVFSTEGFGTVVTGIPVSGTVSVGSEVELVPGGERGRVRGIQRFLRDAREGAAGQCLALNIPDLSRPVPARGQVLCSPGFMTPAAMFHLRLRTVPGLEQPVRNAERIKFHTGTSEQDGKIYLLESQELGGGADAWATAVLDSPIAAAGHDRYIVRRPSPAETIGGGEILFADHDARRAQRKQTSAMLSRYAAAIQGVDPQSEEGVRRRVEYHLLEIRPVGASIDALCHWLMQPSELVARILGELRDAGEILQLAADHWIHARRYAGFLETMEHRLKEFQARPDVLSIPSGDLRKEVDLPQPLWTRLLGELERKGLVRVQGSRLLLQAAGDKLSVAERALATRIEAAYEQSGFQSPRPDELPDLLNAPVPQVGHLLEYLCNEGRLVRISPAVMLSRAWTLKAQELVLRLIRERGHLDSADFKNDIGSTRKYALAILDYLDARRVTLRIGNNRKLAPGYERNLLT
jgi:selenocysteine-specific elongation factor